MGRRGERLDLLKKFGWTSLASVFQMMTGILSVVVLTRFLTPTDYGLFGLAIIAIAPGEALANGPFSSQLEQKSEISDADINSVFWANLAIALVAAAIILPLAGLIAHRSALPEAVPVIWAATGFMVLSAAGVVPIALLRRRQMFRAVSQINVTAAGIGLAAAIGLALAGTGVWALVGFEAVRRVVILVTSYAKARWLPNGGFSMAHFRAMLPFTTGVLMGQLVGRADALAPRAAAAIFLGPAGLGLLSVAIRVADQIQSFVATPIGAMALPVLSSAAGDRSRLYAIMADAWRMISITSFPMLVGLAAVAPIFLPVAVGEKFADVGPVAAIILLANMRIVTSRVNITATQAVGKAYMASASIAVSFVAHVVLLALLARYGIVWIAVAVLLRSFITWPIAGWIVKATTGFGMMRQARIMAPPFLASLIMGGCVVELGALLGKALSPFVTTGVLVVAGTLIYALSIYLVDPWVRRAAPRFLKHLRERYA